MNQNSMQAQSLDLTWWKSNKESTGTSEVEACQVEEKYSDDRPRIKVKAGNAEKGFAFYPVAPPNVIPPVIRNVTRKDLAVPAIHPFLRSSRESNKQPAEVKKEKPTDP